MTRLIRSALALALTAGLGCSSSTEVPPTASVVSTGMKPLMDMTGRHFGLSGGLYGNSSNIEPRAHLDSAKAAARRVRPASGSYAILSIGYSNLSHEFCCVSKQNTNPTYTAESFMGQAAADPAVRHGSQVLVNGAIGGQTNATWDQPGDTNYTIVKSRLAQKQLTEAQVRVVILKIANSGPTRSLPDPAADAYALMVSTGSIIRALKARYPNLQMVFVLSRIYGGYATSPTNPEPYAYETGFAVQRVIMAQAAQFATGAIDPLVGDLRGVWVGWGPYLWADGTTPRSDGLQWLRTDFATDGMHPSAEGIRKVGLRLLNAFKNTSYTSCWFLANRTC